jgi:pimeloyl-ACP methyl ester carboxylesterase
VFCAPLGRDYLLSHYALRRYAVRLEEKGFCVVRFDYDGTGDSVGKSSDPDRVGSWLEGVSSAIGLLRDAGIKWVALAGMRSGALLADAAAEKDGSIDALVLIDPIQSGRSFVSEQRAVAAMSLGVQEKRDDGSVETPGVVYDRQTVEDLKKLRIGSEPSAKEVFVLPRRGTSVDGGLADRLGKGSVTWGEVTGQEDLVDAEAPNQRLPLDDIERVAEWVSEVAPAEEVAVKVPRRAGAAAVAEGQGGRQVVERPVALGPAGLFGIVTEVPGRSSGPTIVFLNVATEPHVGPARLWVDLAREWAVRGLRSVRVDMTGLGESPARLGEPEFVIRLPVNFDDVTDIAKAVSPDDPSDVVLMGLCSSAYQALDSALGLRPRGVVALNPVITFQPPEMLAGQPVYERRRVALPRGNVIQQFSGEGALSGLRKRFPGLGWRIRTLMAFGSRPTAWLKELTSSGVDLMLVCGDREARPIRQGSSTRQTSKLAASGNFRFEFIPGLDHGLLVAAHRERIRSMVTEHLLTRFASERSPDEQEPDTEVLTG